LGQGPQATGTFHGYPAAFLTASGAVLSGKSRKGKVLLESELERLGIVAKHFTPCHPQTCGKVERFHRTLKRYLAKQAPAASLAVLQARLDTFRTYYNQHRPHRALHGDTPCTPSTRALRLDPPQRRHLPTTASATIASTSPAGSPCATAAASTTSTSAAPTRGSPSPLLIANKNIRILAEDGSLLCQLTLDPSRDYQPLGTRPGPPKLSAMS
jgi:hypothetical protein